MLRGRERHEPACASCRAPLHDLKARMIPKTCKGLAGRAFEEAFDVIEDIFD
ncbi:MAG: hypothetical protein ACLFQL_10005 [Paracoccaceae bacterium]